MKCHNTKTEKWRGLPLKLQNTFQYRIMTEVQYSTGNAPHFDAWFTNLEANSCQTADVQSVDGSDLLAHADLQEWPKSGSSDVCWLTVVPKLASWQLCCWGLSVLAGRRFDPDPTSLTSWQDFCSKQQSWHWRTNAHTHILGRLGHISSLSAMAELQVTVPYMGNRTVASYGR